MANPKLADPKIEKLLSMAEQKSVLNLSELQSALGFKEMEELEMFLIEAITSKVVNGKIDETKGVFTVTSFEYQEFGRKHFLILKDRLGALLANLRMSHENLKELNSKPIPPLEI